MVDDGRRTDGRTTDDGRTTEHGYTISSPCEPDGSGELKNGLQNLSEGERALGMMQGLAAPKMPPLTKMWRSFTTWLCVTGAETCEVGIRFRTVQTILTDILGMSMGTNNVD